MNRKYTRQMFLDSVQFLQEKNPDFTFTTDVIVGFPGETEKDFSETVELIKSVRFAKVHMFPYSKRPRTRASLYPDQVPLNVIKRRKNELLHISEQTAFQLREKFVGRKMKVLLEKPEGDKIYGHTENFLRVELPKKGLRANEIIDVELVENTPLALKAKVC